MGREIVKDLDAEIIELLKMLLNLMMVDES
jgi:hypothetical protein